MSNRTCFINANLLDGEHPAKPGSSVVVEGNRIATVTTEALTPQPGDVVIDCAGRTLMPGMTSGHFHPTYRDVTSALMPPLGYERSPAAHAYVAADSAVKAIRAGVTTVVGANCPWDIDPALRDAIEEGILIGPRLIPCSRDLITTGDSNDTTPRWWDSNALGGVRLCDGPEEFRKAVRDEIQRGAEMIKLYPTGGHGVRLSGDTLSLSREELHAAVEAAHGLGVRVRAHVASKAALMRCLEEGVEIIDHGDGLDDECIKAMVETNAFLLPSVHGFSTLVDEFTDEDLQGDTLARMGGQYDVLKAAAQGFRAMCEVLPAAMEAGVRICLGDDYGGAGLPHGSYGKEPAVFVKYASIPPLEVLRWATVNGGLLFGREDLGRVEEGFLADMIVVNGDPTEDINVLGDTDNIHTVMRVGKLLVHN
jgi:imidazolonepropionase-like amidohydrolase